MVRAALENDFAKASALNEVLYPLFVNLFVEPNPAPIKAAMKDEGLIKTSEVRRPLCSLGGESYKLVSDTVNVLKASLES